MDSEKILFCYRDDKLKKPVFYETADENTIMAALPCTKTIWGRKVPRSVKRIKMNIAALYENTGASFLWLDEDLCEFLQLEKMDLPQILFENWLMEVPFYHTLILGDDKKLRALEFFRMRTSGLAAACVVCYEEDVFEYRYLAEELFENEGIVLQIFSYEELENDFKLFCNHVRIKGTAAVIDLDDRSRFWDKRLLKDMRYHSFWKEIRLFLDTFRKNGYNTLTK